MAHPTQVNSRPPQGVPAKGRVCGGTTRSGFPCNAPATPGAEWCWNHDPAHAAERKRNARRAGRTRPGSRVKDLDELLANLYQDALDGRVDRGVAAVLCQIVHGRTRLLEVERRIAEVERFEKRVSELEAIVAERSRTGRGGRW